MTMFDLVIAAGKAARSDRAGFCGIAVAQDAGRHAQTGPNGPAGTIADLRPAAGRGASPAR